MSETELSDGQADVTEQDNPFFKSFEQEQNPEKKLEMAIDFMQASLQQEGMPHFKTFWEARKLCLPLFKETIAPAHRAHLWNRYSELSKEARRLKEILDEQSAFAVEQIEIAIKALEAEQGNFDAAIAQVTWETEAPFPNTLEQHREQYELWQKQLNLLNTHATRINALRKELLKTDMRVRHKNKFFQRLSQAGDAVFPKRKELIKQLSLQFIADVDHFISTNFQEGADHRALHLLRDEIKSLQAMAKVLTLNSQAFTQTRTRLSKCWDELKNEGKERKKEWLQQKQAFQESGQEGEKRLQAIKAEWESGELADNQVEAQLSEVASWMKQVPLGREELKFLRDFISSIRKAIQDKYFEQEKVRNQAEQEKKQRLRESFNVLKEKISKLLQDAATLNAVELTEARDALISEIQASQQSKVEKQDLEKQLKSLKDLIQEKNEQALLEISEDDRQALQNLKDILAQRKERRQEIKSVLESLRKAAGSSHSDFEKALALTAQQDEEKERLEKANQGIQEIEAKIAEIQISLRGKK